MAQCINNDKCLGLCFKQQRVKQWNRMLETRKTKKTFSAPSLYEIAKLKVRETYRQNWDEIKCLPKTIQNELLVDWLQCGETFPLSDSEEDKVKQLVRYEEPFDPNRTLPVSPSCFIALMEYPWEVPEFTDEWAHVHFKYVVKTNYNTNARNRMCTTCFHEKSLCFKPYSENLWKQNNETYYLHTDHNVVEGEYVLEEVVWDSNNWCDFCITEPLFFIVDKDTCKSDYGLHTRKRPNFWNDYSTDDDSDIDYCNIKRIKGNEIDDCMFKSLHL